ncbi:MAG: EamA family transporter [Spirochaetes bacterium]|nr:EamA family transporter [Spirochaetota bacterium]
MAKIYGVLFIILSVIFGAVGQILMKTGMSKIGTLAKDTKFLDAVVYFIRAIFSPLVFSGLFSYLISMIIWLWVLSKYELSYARPFVSIGYVVIILYSFFVLGENINLLRWIGIFLTLIGVILVTKS